jgi:hypothetical protein
MLVQRYGAIQIDTRRPLNFDDVTTTLVLLGGGLWVGIWIFLVELCFLGRKLRRERGYCISTIVVSVKC